MDILINSLPMMLLLFFAGTRYYLKKHPEKDIKNWPKETQKAFNKNMNIGLSGVVLVLFVVILIIKL